MKKRNIINGLQGKLLVLFLLVSIVPLVSVTLLSFEKSKTSLLELSSNRLGDKAAGLQREVDLIMGNWFNDINAWANNPVIAQGIQEKSFREVDETLSVLAKTYKDCKLIMVFDSTGNLVAASNPDILVDSSVKKNQAGREWFKKVMGGAIDVEDLNFSSIVKDNVVGFSAPIKDSAGGIIGVISNQMSWSVIDKAVEEMKHGKTAYAYMLNREGVVIAHPNKEKILKLNVTKNENKELATTAERMVKGEAGSATYAFEGVHKAVSFVPSKGYGGFKGIGWSYAMTMADSEVLLPIYNLRRLLFYLIAIAIAAIVVISLLVARSVSRPLLEGVSFAQAVASGDLTQTFVVKSRDEVGDLANAMNTMVAGLKEMVGKIRDSSGQLATAAGQISANSAQLTKSTHSQASASDETSANMVQMAALIQTVANNADSLASDAEEVSSSISELGAASEQVANSAGTMASSVSETSATIEQMTVSIEKVARSAEDLASSVTETSSSIEQMAVSIDQVAGNAQELQKIVVDSAAIIEQMAASINQVAKNVNEADFVAKSAAKEGNSGLQAGQQAAAGMARVADVIDKTSASIVNLGKRSEEIGGIVKVINEIADQTNLLALNAAIEAARAGDAGRGFAVVAEEVRKLAERSMVATKEIAQVIRQVQADTNESVKYGEIASKEAKASMELTTLAGNAISNIVASIEQTSALMSDIARMTAEQAKASSQVTRSVEKMNLATDIVASASREQALGGRQIRLAVERMNHINQEVTLATKEQAVGSRQIRVAVENMTQVTSQVSIATTEQFLSARQIVVAVNGMNALTQSVANATAVQKKGGEMVVTAMENITDLTRENLSSVEQLSSSAQSLSMQAEELAGMVADFRV